MRVNVEIFSQGEEVLSGQTVDSNAAWLSQQLIARGLTVTRHTTVGDRLADLQTLLQEIATRADCCICTGGLGPTVDDLTAQAVARAFSLPLEFDATAYQQIAAFFSRRNRAMPEANRKQAMLPQGALRLDNDWGTAPGFSLQYQRCRFIFVPGVPYEMRQMYQARILPLLQRHFTSRPQQLLTIKTIGIGESDIQQQLQELQLPADVTLSFRAGPEEVQTKFLFPADYQAAQITALSRQAAELIGDFVFAIDKPADSPATLVSVIAKLIAAQAGTIRVRETISQGLLAAKCRGESWLQASYFAPTAAQHCRQAGIEQQQDLLKTAGCLAAALIDTASDTALVQLYQGSAAAINDQKQQITLYNALAIGEQLHYRVIPVGGPAHRKQNQAAILALDMLRRVLQGQSLQTNKETLCQQLN